MSDTEKVVSELDACASSGDFAKAFELVKGNRDVLSKRLQAAGIGDALRRATKDRVILSFIDGVGFGKRPLDEVLIRLERLLSFEIKALVLSKAWGLGTVVRIDAFYRRITVDFRTQRGHQFSYDAAAEMLVCAPEDHILVFRQSDPAGFEQLFKEKPGEFVKRILKSYGDMPIVRLEDVCVANGFVKKDGFKKFWEGARAELRQDKCVEIPARRAEPIRLRAKAEEYGDTWLMAFAHETDPKRILSDVLEFEAQGRFKTADEATRATIGERLGFAVTAARKVDDALFARLANLVVRLGYLQPPAESMRGYLWERNRFIRAAELLPAREVGNMIAFLAADDASKARLYGALDKLCYAAVFEVLEKFGGDGTTDENGNVTAFPCREAVAAFMRQPKAPSTLVTLLVGKYEKYRDWKELPGLIELLMHAIMLGEGRQSGETLKMQNIVRRLFASSDWLGKVFGWLSESDRARFFERFQASIAWDPSTHHTTVVRMVHLAPELERLVVKPEQKREYARITSPRSFALKKADYLRLINEEMPANVKRIEFAKGFGDLSENAEYQYAKDEQRALMQKQTLMQADLEAVKPGDFADATTDEVMPGVTVVADTPEGEKVWTILGEWDNDLERGILSSKTRVAQNLLGKKPGENFELPDTEGNVRFATLREIRPLSDEIRAWMQVPAGMQI